MPKPQFKRVLTTNHRLGQTRPLQYRTGGLMRLTISNLRNRFAAWKIGQLL